MLLLGGEKVEGWISLHRKIQSNIVWQDKPFSKGQAWIDLLLTVNYEDRKILLGNQLILVKRGSTITSIRKLGEKWGWSNSKVRAFLELLQADQMLTYVSDTKKTVITIEKYSDYQSQGNTETQQKEHQNTTKASPKHTNNNINNTNKKNIYIDHVELTPDEYNSLLEKLGSEETREDYITRLNNYIGQIGVKKANNKYKSHYHVILNWHRKDVANGANKPRTIPSNAKNEKDEIAKRAGVISL